MTTSSIISIINLKDYNVVNLNDNRNSKYVELILENFFDLTLHVYNERNTNNIELLHHVNFISSIVNYMNNKFPIENCLYSSFNGKYYNDLTVPERRKLNSKQIKITFIKEKTYNDYFKEI